MSTVKCEACSLVEAMLIEWRRHVEKAKFNERDLNNYHQWIVEAENKITERERLLTVIPEGPAAERIKRDIDALRLNIERYERDASNAQIMLSSNHREAASFLAAACAVEPCGHVGYLTEGVQPEPSGKFRTPPRLYMYERRDEFASSIGKDGWVPGNGKVVMFWPESIS